MARAVVLIAFWEEFVVGPKGESAYSHIYGLFLPKVSTIYVIMLNVIEREQRMPLRRGEEKRSENRERERERQCRTEQEKEKEIKTETERKIEKKRGGRLNTSHLQTQGKYVRFLCFPSAYQDNRL